MENRMEKYDEEIFQLLLQKHNEAKTKGEGFYFLLVPRLGRKGFGEVEGQFYWLGRDPFLKAHRIELHFWDNRYAGIGLRIEKVNHKYAFSCFAMVIAPYFKHYPNGKNEKIETIIQALQKEDARWKEMTEGDLVFYKKEYLTQTQLSTGLWDFIEKDKQKIDDLIRKYDAETNTSLSPCLISKEDFEYQLRLGYFLKEQQTLPIVEHALPLAISRFFIQGYQAIKDVEIKYISPATQWIFLTGENAKGKTTLLETLWHALLSGDAFKQIKQAGFGVCIEVFEKGKYRQSDCYIKEEHFSNLLGAKNPLSTWGSGLYLSKVAAFGSSRISTQKEYVKGISPFGNEPFLLDINQELFKRKVSEKYRYQFDILETAFKTLLPQLSHIDIDIDELEDRKKVHYYEKDEDGNLLGQVHFEQLAAGYQNIINLVGNIIFLLSEEIEGNIHIKTPQELYGIVIIDELELHLHPKMQRFLVEKLTELFPKVQFIVSTHSPIPLLGAPKESVTLHVDRTKEKGITVEKLEIDFQHLLPEALLSSPIFDFDSFLKRNGDSFDKFSTENDYNEVVFDKMLEEKLEKLAAEGGKKLSDILNKNK